MRPRPGFASCSLFLILLGTGHWFQSHVCVHLSVQHWVPRAPPTRCWEGVSETTSLFLRFQAIWMMDPKDVSEGQHEEFYRYVAQAHDRPRYTLHYRTDAPLSIRSIFYVPDAVRAPTCPGPRSGRTQPSWL